MPFPGIIYEAGKNSGTDRMDKCRLRDFCSKCLLFKFVIPFIGFEATVAAEERMPITVLSKTSEARETASWEEPALFPGDDEVSSTQLPLIKKARKATSREADPLNIASSETNEASALRSETEFQSNSQIAESETNSLGFSASRERDAILARIQNDTTTQPYNIKIGRIPLRLAASLDFDFTDNAIRSSRSQETELIILPRLDISGSVKLASKTTLSLGLGFGYIKYLNQAENDRLLAVASLSPNTGVSLDFKIGKFLVSVYDRPLVPQFQADIATQRNQSQYSQFSNIAGLNVLWNINSRTNLSLRYNHANLISLTSEKRDRKSVV